MIEFEVMIEATYDWKKLDEMPDEGFLKASKKAKISDLTAKILWARGVREVETAKRVLSPSLADLHDPFLLHDMDKAVARIREAIEAGEKILIYGDYDADGMTSASIMRSALDEIYDEDMVQVYLPNRFTDGYGPNLNVYKYFIEKEEIKLIITVDNGVSGKEEIAWAVAHGCDVVVTDHHSLPDELPECSAIVHPKHPESDYPFDDLCGAGVAFKVACALLEYLPSEMLDLVAIGTVADMVSLRFDGENRILVAEGLKVLAQTERQGLLELMRLAGVDLSELTEETIGFQIAPRLNALGRLDDPNPAIELLCGWDEEKGLEIAQLIDKRNSERRALTEKIFVEAETILTGDAVEVLWKEGWHTGVLGIVAGRLLEKYHKPFVILSADENGELRGSARSIPAYNLFEALNAHRDLFVNFGGHAQAAGMTIVKDKVADLKQVLLDFIDSEHLNMSVKPELELVDSSIRLDKIDLALIKSLSALAPFGIGNPQPYFLIKDFKVMAAQTMGSGNQHLKLKIQQDKTLVNAVYFGHGSEALEFEQADVELAVKLSTNTWNGQTTVQLMIEDARAVGLELIDVRSKAFELSADSLKNMAFFEQNSLQNDIMKNGLVIKEAPTDEKALSVLKAFVKENKSLGVIYFQNKIDKNYYLTGAGSREQYATLYKTILHYKEFDIRYKVKTLADFVKIPEILLIQMIRVFEELEFVKIEDGLMTVNVGANKRQISDSQIYQELTKTVKEQEFWALAAVKEIYQHLLEN